MTTQDLETGISLKKDIADLNRQKTRLQARIDANEPLYIEGFYFDVEASNNFLQSAITSIDAQIAAKQAAFDVL